MSYVRDVGPEVALGVIEEVSFERCAPIDA
jgi:hypothetical protein